MNYMEIYHYDTANGIKIRNVLFVSGCNNFCKGCYNQQTWDENAGRLFDEDAYQDLTQCFRDKARSSRVDGITLTGGDPLYINNRKDITSLVKRFKSEFPDKTIWCYTGHLYDNVKDLEIMEYIDVLVDGRFILEQRNLMLPYCGSENQRVIDIKKTREIGDIVLFWKKEK